MRIAQIAPLCYLEPKYYRSNEYFLCSGLVKLGHEVIAFTSDKQPKWLEFGEKKIELREEEIDGFTVKRVREGPKIGIVPSMPTLLNVLLNMQFDVIHAHEFFAISSFYSALACKVKRIPLVITQHNDQIPPMASHAFLYYVNGYTIGKYALSYAKKIIALDRSIEQHLARFGVKREKIELIPNAINTEMFSPGQKNLLEEKWGITSPVVLFVGRLVKDKGVEYLLRAFSDVVKGIPEAKLVIVGVGPDEKELKALRRELHLTNVFFLGQIENKLMPKIYSGCDFLVLPSVYEPFGNVVIEAMATGKPVVGTFVGGIKDTIVHGVTGYHVQPRNSKQMAHCISKLLSDASLTRNLGENARRIALEKYDEGHVLKRIEKIYYDSTAC